MLRKQLTIISAACLFLTIPLQADLICGNSDEVVVDLIDSQGNDSGWSVVLLDDVHSGIVVDHVGSDYVGIEIAKDLTCFDGSQFVPHMILFRQRLADELTVATIRINDEIVRNLTGLSWTDYHWELDGPGAAFKATATDASGFSVDPFTNRTWGANVWDADHAAMLDVDGGLIPVGGTFTPGLQAGALTIDVDLALDDSNFVLTQVPTPEPTALGIIVVGGLLVLARRRRRAL